MIAMDDILCRESAKLENDENLEFKIDKRDANYLTLKQKIIATSSVISSYKICKTQCEEKDIEIKSLKEECASLKNDYKKTLLDHMTLDKNYEELARKFEYLKEQNAALEIKENSTQAHNKQLQNLLMETEEKLENSEKEVENIKVNNSTLKAENNTQLRKHTHSFEKKITSLYKSIFKFGDKAKSSGILNKEEKAFLQKCKTRAKSDGVTVENIDASLHISPKIDDILEETEMAGPPSCASTDTGRGSSIYTSDDEKYPSGAATPTKDARFSPRRGDFNSSFDAYSHVNLNKVDFTDALLKNLSKHRQSSPVKVIVSPNKTSPIKLRKNKSPGRPMIKENSVNIVSKVKEFNSSNGIDESQIKNILNEMKSSVNFISPLPSDEDTTIDTSKPAQVKLKKLLRRRFKPVKYSLVRKIQQKKLQGLTSYLMALTKKIAKEEVNKALQAPTVPKNDSNNQNSPSNDTPVKPPVENGNPVVIIQGLNSMNQVSIPQGPGVYIINNIPMPTQALAPPAVNLDQRSHVSHSVGETATSYTDRQHTVEENSQVPFFSDELTSKDVDSLTVKNKSTHSNCNANEIVSEVPVHVVSPVRRSLRRVACSSGSAMDKNNSRVCDTSHRSVLKKKAANVEPKKISKKNFDNLFDSDSDSSDLTVSNKHNVLNIEKKRKRITDEKKPVSPRKRQKRRSFNGLLENEHNVSSISKSTIKSTDTNETNFNRVVSNVPVISQNNDIRVQAVIRENCDKIEKAKLLLADYYKEKEKPIPKRKLVKKLTPVTHKLEEIMQDMTRIPKRDLISSENKLFNMHNLGEILDIPRSLSDRIAKLNANKLVSEKSNDNLPSVTSVDEEAAKVTLNLSLASEGDSSIDETPALPVGASIKDLKAKTQRDLVVHNYDIFGPEVDSPVKCDQKVFASIVRNNMNSQKMMKLHKKTEKPITDLHKLLEEYLLNNFSKARLDSLLEKIMKEKEKSVALAMVTFLSQERNNDSLMIYQPKVPPMNIYHQALLCCINRLHSDPPSHYKQDIFELTMRGIENKAFVLGVNSPSLRSLSNMTTFYAVLCRITKQKDRLKLFCMDAMYCYTYKSTPIIYATLQSWPQLFPKSHFFVAKDPLLVVLVHCLLSNFSERIEFKCDDMKRLLLTKYGFKPGEYNDDGLVKFLMGSVNDLSSSTPTKNLQAAFLLLAKRYDVNNCYKKIIIGSLLPVLDDAKASAESRAFVAGLIGPLVRPFPASMTMECEIFIKKLSVMLNTGDSPLVEEGLASSLTYLSKKNFNLAVRTLMQWKPSGPVSEHTRSLMTSLVSEKPFNFWNNILPIS